MSAPAPTLVPCPKCPDGHVLVGPVPIRCRYCHGTGLAWSTPPTPTDEVFAALEAFITAIDDGEGAPTPEFRAGQVDFAALCQRGRAALAGARRPS